MSYCDASAPNIAATTPMMPSSTIPTQNTSQPPPVGSGPDALGGGDGLGGGLGLGGGVSCVGRFGGRGGGAGREDEPAPSFLSYSALLTGSLRISHASFSRLVVASAVGLGFRSG